MNAEELNPAFERYWEACYEDLWNRGISHHQARDVFEDATRLMTNQMMHKAQEFLARPSTHPAKAILEALAYTGQPINIEQQYNEFKAEFERQSAEAFPELVKKKNHALNHRRRSRLRRRG